ncbi:hypothetical protein V8F20_003110 [Naviculisporaceae sp. PSN 640]
MSNMVNTGHVTPESTAPSSNNIGNGAKQDNLLTGKSLAFMTKAQDEFEGSSTSGTMDHQVPRVIEPFPWSQVSTPYKLASTPPPDEIPVTQAQLVSGAGCLFPSLPPSRASTLTVSSEAAHQSSSSGGPTTPVREVIRFGDNDDFATPVVQRKQATGILFPPGIPWTPPNSTPRPRYEAKKKRSSSSSPPPSPRPPKLAKFQRWGQSLSSSSIPRLVEDEGFCEELPDEQSQQTLAFRNAREHTFVLATNTEFQPTVASTTRRGLFHVFGSSFVSNENDGNDGDDEAGESVASMSATLDGRSEDLVLGSESIGGTSVHCNYGQDELIVEVEWFTEDEIEAQLSEYLAAYRAVYLVASDEDEEEQESSVAANEKNKNKLVKDTAAVESADPALEVFRMMAHGRLNWAELDMVLKEEEEDVLDVFMTWVQDMAVPKKTQTETFFNIKECLGYLRKLSVPSKKPASDIKALPFIRKIRLWSNGCLDRFLNGLPGVRGVNASSLSFDGAIEWEFDEIYCGLAEKEVAELVTAWDDFMIRDE